MSDLMLYGVLTMPFELAMGSELSQRQFYDRVQELIKRESEPLRMNWIKTSERLPVEGVQVLVVNSHCKKLAELITISGFKYWLAPTAREFEYFTHWQSLPPLPEEQG